MLVTHSFLLLLGFLAVYEGFREIEAAERSTAAGGGLLSPVALLPFFLAVPLIAFAMCSILVALLAIPQPHSDSR
jgi:hypothetical protein